MTITAMIIVKTMRRRKIRRRIDIQKEKKKTWNSLGHFDSFDSC